MKIERKPKQTTQKIIIENKPKPIVDRIFTKLFSRKLLTFIVASVFLGIGSLTSTDWTLIACLYIGTQGAIDFYRIKNASSGIGEPL